MFSLGRTPNYRAILAVLLLLGATSSFAAAASAPGATRRAQPRDGSKPGKTSPLLYQIKCLPNRSKGQREAIGNLRKQRVCHSLLPRLFQRRRNTQTSKRNPTASRLFTQPRTQGTFITVGLRPPTQEKVSKRYWGTSPIQFNHAFVGMTTPYLQIETPSSCGNHDFSVDNDNGDDDEEKVTRLVSLHHRGQDPNTNAQPDTASAASEWWPEGPYKSLIGHRRWRVLCLRQRVGYGSECYERVKEAALQFEFSNADKNKGIVSVVPPRSQQRGRFLRFSLPDEPTQPEPEESFPEQALGHATTNAVSIWSGGGRRLATFVQWCPLLWAVSPVSVVYQAVDQVAPSTTSRRCAGKNTAAAAAAGDLYSCGAFATLKGHWIRGEERVTVAWRQNTGAVDVEILSLSQAAPGLWGTIAWPLLGHLQKSFFVQQLNSLQEQATSPVAAAGAEPCIPQQQQQQQHLLPQQQQPFH